MARPKTTDVVRREIEAMIPSIVAQIAQAMSNKSAPQVQAIKASASPKMATRVVAATAGEKVPEGGYADCYEVRSASLGTEARPPRGPEAVLENNFNVYFWRESDGQSVKPVAQVREMLKAAGYQYAGRFHRWYGNKANLPATLKGGIKS